MHIYTSSITTAHADPAMQWAVRVCGTLCQPSKIWIMIIFIQCN